MAAATAIASVLAKVPWVQVWDVAQLGWERAQKLSARVRDDDAVVPKLTATTDVVELRATMNHLLADQAELRAELAQASDLLIKLAQTNQTIVAKLQVRQQWFWGLVGVSGASLLFAAIALLR